MTGQELCKLMRRHKVTIKVLSERLGITQKRIREARKIGLSGEQVSAWLTVFAGSTPSEPMPSAARVTREGHSKPVVSVAVPAFDRVQAKAGESLVARYRPQTLAEVLGQPEVTASLGRFVGAPYPAAMLFCGESGTGKTSAAYALANDLGCAMADAELGGFFEIPSGCMSADQVRESLNLLRFRPLMGSGWKVLVVNECDRMSLPAETIWLDALEHLPVRTVVIFTTNDPSRLSKRFRDRCEEYHFRHATEELRPYIEALAQRLWEQEGMPGVCPGLDKLGVPTMGDLDAMHASFRLALQQLQRKIRDAKGQISQGEHP